MSTDKIREAIIANVTAAEREGFYFYREAVLLCVAVGGPNLKTRNVGNSRLFQHRDITLDHKPGGNKNSKVFWQLENMVQEILKYEHLKEEYRGGTYAHANNPVIILTPHVDIADDSSVEDTKEAAHEPEAVELPVPEEVKQPQPRRVGQKRKKPSKQPKTEGHNKSKSKSKSKGPPPKRAKTSPPHSNDQRSERKAEPSGARFVFEGMEFEFEPMIRAVGDPFGADNYIIVGLRASLSSPQQVSAINEYIRREALAGRWPEAVRSLIPLPASYFDSHPPGITQGLSSQVVVNRM
jgi:hypothetical protein